MTPHSQGALHGVEAPVWLQEAWPGTKDPQSRVNPHAHHKENVLKPPKDSSSPGSLGSKGSSHLHGVGWKSSTS